MKTLLAFLLLISELSFARPDYWTQVDQFVGEVPLCEAFVNDTEYRFQRETCSFTCDKWEYTIKIYCSSGEARLDYYKPGGIFARTIIKESDWQRLKANMLRAKAESANSSGLAFDLTGVTETQDKLLVSYQVRSKSKTIEKGTWTMHRQSQALFQLWLREETALIPLKEKRTDQLMP